MVDLYYCVNVVEFMDIRDSLTRTTVTREDRDSRGQYNH